jgi:hypothetical protein
VNTAEEFFQGLRGDRRDRAAGYAGVLQGPGRKPDRKPDREHRALFRDRDRAARGGQGDGDSGDSGRVLGNTHSYVNVTLSSHEQ